MIHDDDSIYFWLVVWNILYFSIQVGMSSSQLTNSIIFQRGWLKPPSRFDIWMFQDKLMAMVNQYHSSKDPRWDPGTTPPWVIVLMTTSDVAD